MQSPGKQNHLVDAGRFPLIACMRLLPLDRTCGQGAQLYVPQRAAENPSPKYLRE